MNCAIVVLCWKKIVETESTIACSNELVSAVELTEILESPFLYCGKNF